MQQQAMRYYLGVHPKAPILGCERDLDWISTQVNQYCKIAK